MTTPLIAALILVGFVLGLLAATDPAAFAALTGVVAR